MKILVALLLLLVAHFSLTPFAPAPKAWIAWPFGQDSKPWLRMVGGLPSKPGGLVTALLSGLAGAGFLLAALGLFWHVIPSAWWPSLVAIASAASGLLYLLYIGPWAVLPLLLDAVLIWGLVGPHWTVALLGG